MNYESLVFLLSNPKFYCKSCGIHGKCEIPTVDVFIDTKNLWVGVQAPKFSYVSTALSDIWSFMLS